jgi:CTP:molybdopterin cytidylyltransferase MocA
MTTAFDSIESTRHVCRHRREPVAGLVLAAGAGRRYGGPKALVRDASGVSWVERSIQVLQDGGSSTVYVVVGAAARQVTELVGDRAVVVPAPDWEEGMHRSFVAGIEAVAGSEADLAVVMLVDTPDVNSAVVGRVLDQAGQRPAVLARAAYEGRPGHPVVIGRCHFQGAMGSARAGAGARDYLTANAVQLVECGQLATGRDVDRSTLSYGPGRGR